MATPGLHNVRNAAAATVMAVHLGADIEPAQRKVAELGLGDRVRFLGHRDDAREQSERSRKVQRDLDQSYPGLPVCTIERMSPPPSGLESLAEMGARITTRR